MGGRRRRGRAEKEGETRRERDAKVSETQHRCSNVCTEPGQSPPGVEMEQRDHHSLLKKKRHKVVGRNSSQVLIKHSFDDSWNIVEIQWGLKALIKWVEPKPNKYSIIFIIINKSLLAAIIMRKTWDASAKTLHLYDKKVTRLSIPRKQITQSTQSKTSGEKGKSEKLLSILAS